MVMQKYRPLQPLPVWSQSTYLMESENLFMQALSVSLFSLGLTLPLKMILILHPQGKEREGERKRRKKEVKEGGRKKEE